MKKLRSVLFFSVTALVFTVFIAFSSSQNFEVSHADPTDPPSPTDTPSASPTDTSSPSPTDTSSPSPTDTNSPTPSPTDTNSPSPSPSVSPIIGTCPGELVYDANFNAGIGGCVLQDPTVATSFDISPTRVSKAGGDTLILTGTGLGKAFSETSDALPTKLFDQTGLAFMFDKNAASKVQTIGGAAPTYADSFFSSQGGALASPDDQWRQGWGLNQDLQQSTEPVLNETAPFPVQTSGSAPQITQFSYSFENDIDFDCSQPGTVFQASAENSSNQANNLLKISTSCSSFPVEPTISIEVPIIRPYFGTTLETININDTLISSLPSQPTLSVQDLGKYTVSIVFSGHITDDGSADSWQQKIYLNSILVSETDFQTEFIPTAISRTCIGPGEFTAEMIGTDFVCHSLVSSSSSLDNARMYVSALTESQIQSNFAAKTGVQNKVKIGTENCLNVNVVDDDSLSCITPQKQVAENEYVYVDLLLDNGGLLQSTSPLSWTFEMNYYSYSSSDGSPGTPISETVAIDDILPNAPTITAKPGYLFEGWFSNPNPWKFNIPSLTCDGSKYLPPNDTTTGGQTTVDSDPLDLYACFTIVLPMRPDAVDISILPDNGPVYGGNTVTFVADGLSDSAKFLTANDPTAFHHTSTEFPILSYDSFKGTTYPWVDGLTNSWDSGLNAKTILQNAAINPQSYSIDFSFTNTCPSLSDYSGTPNPSPISKTLFASETVLSATILQVDVSCNLHKADNVSHYEDFVEQTFTITNPKLLSPIIFTSPSSADIQNITVTFENLSTDSDFVTYYNGNVVDGSSISGDIPESIGDYCFFFAASDTSCPTSSNFDFSETNVLSMRLYNSALPILAVEQNFESDSSRLQFVKIGTQKCQNIVFIDSRRFQCVIPGVDYAQNVDVELYFPTLLGGNVVLNDGYHYQTVIRYYPNNIISPSGNLESGTFYEDEQNVGDLIAPANSDSFSFATAPVGYRLVAFTDQISDFRKGTCEGDRYYPSDFPLPPNFDPNAINNEYKVPDRPITIYACYELDFPSIPNFTLSPDRGKMSGNEKTVLNGVGVSNLLKYGDEFYGMNPKYDYDNANDSNPDLSPVLAFDSHKGDNRQWRDNISAFYHSSTHAIDHLTNASKIIQNEYAVEANIISNAKCDPIDPTFDAHIDTYTDQVLPIFSVSNAQGNNEISLSAYCFLDITDIDNPFVMSSFLVTLNQSDVIEFPYDIETPTFYGLQHTLTLSIAKEADLSSTLRIFIDGQVAGAESLTTLSVQTPKISDYCIALSSSASDISTCGLSPLTNSQIDLQGFRIWDRIMVDDILPTENTKRDFEYYNSVKIGDNSCLTVLILGDDKVECTTPPSLYSGLMDASISVPTAIDQSGFATEKNAFTYLVLVTYHSNNISPGHPLELVEQTYQAPGDQFILPKYDIDLNGDDVRGTDGFTVVPNQDYAFYGWFNNRNDWNSASGVCVGDKFKLSGNGSTEQIVGNEIDRVPDVDTNLYACYTEKLPVIPSAISFSPNSGSLKGGTKVTVSGTKISDVVKFRNPFSGVVNPNDIILDYDTYKAPNPWHDAIANFWVSGSQARDKILLQALAIDENYAFDLTFTAACVNFPAGQDQEQETTIFNSFDHANLDSKVKVTTKCVDSSLAANLLQTRKQIITVYINDAEFTSITINPAKMTQHTLTISAESSNISDIFFDGQGIVTQPGLTVAAPDISSLCLAFNQSNTGCGAVEINTATYVSDAINVKSVRVYTSPINDLQMHETNHLYDKERLSPVQIGGVFCDSVTIIDDDNIQCVTPSASTSNNSPVTILLDRRLSPTDRNLSDNFAYRPQLEFYMNNTSKDVEEKRCSGSSNAIITCNGIDAANETLHHFSYVVDTNSQIGTVSFPPPVAANNAPNGFVFAGWFDTDNNYSTSATSCSGNRYRTQENDTDSLSLADLMPNRNLILWACYLRPVISWRLNNAINSDPVTQEFTSGTAITSPSTYLDSSGINQPLIVGTTKVNGYTFRGWFESTPQKPTNDPDAFVNGVSPFSTSCSGTAAASYQLVNQFVDGTVLSSTKSFQGCWLDEDAPIAPNAPALKTHSIDSNRVGVEMSRTSDLAQTRKERLRYYLGTDDSTNYNNILNGTTYTNDFFTDSWYSQTTIPDLVSPADDTEYQIFLRVCDNANNCSKSSSKFTMHKITLNGNFVTDLYPLNQQTYQYYVMDSKNIFETVDFDDPEFYFPTHGSLTPVGWFYGTNCVANVVNNVHVDRPGNPGGNCNTRFDLDTVVTSSFTVYAAWKDIKYNVKYVSNNTATNPAASNGQLYDSLITIPSSPAVGDERNGYTFQGWFYSQSTKPTRDEGTMSNNVSPWAKTCSGVAETSLSMGKQLNSGDRVGAKGIYSNVSDDLKEATFYGCWLDRKAPTQPAAPTFLLQSTNSNKVIATFTRTTDSLQTNKEKLVYSAGVYDGDKSIIASQNFTQDSFTDNSSSQISLFNPTIDQEQTIWIQACDTAGNCSSNSAKFTVRRISYNGNKVSIYSDPQNVPVPSYAFSGKSIQSSVSSGGVIPNAPTMTGFVSGKDRQIPENPSWYSGTNCVVAIGNNDANRPGEGNCNSKLEATTTITSSFTAYQAWGFEEMDVEWQAGNSVIATGGSSQEDYGTIIHLPTYPQIGTVVGGLTFQGWFKVAPTKPNAAPTSTAGFDSTKKTSAYAQSCNAQSNYSLNMGDFVSPEPVLKHTTYYGCWLDKTAPTVPQTFGNPSATDNAPDVTNPQSYVANGMYITTNSSNAKQIRVYYPKATDTLTAQEKLRYCIGTIVNSNNLYGGATCDNIIGGGEGSALFSGTNKLANVTTTSIPEINNPDIGTTYWVYEKVCDLAANCTSVKRSFSLIQITYNINNVYSQTTGTLPATPAPQFVVAGQTLRSNGGASVRPTLTPSLEGFTTNSWVHDSAQNTSGATRCTPGIDPATQNAGPNNPGGTNCNVAFGREITLNKSINVFAVWSRSNYTVTFNYNYERQDGTGVWTNTTPTWSGGDGGIKGTNLPSQITGIPYNNWISSKVSKVTPLPTLVDCGPNNPTSTSPAGRPTTCTSANIDTGNLATTSEKTVKYTFMGWYVGDGLPRHQANNRGCGLGTTKYADKNGNIVQGDGTAGTADTRITSNLTLYACWIPSSVASSLPEIDYTVNFEGATSGAYTYYLDNKNTAPTGNHADQVDIVNMKDNAGATLTSLTNAGTVQITYPLGMTIDNSSCAAAQSWALGGTATDSTGTVSKTRAWSVSPGQTVTIDAIKILLGSCKWTSTAAVTGPVSVVVSTEAALTLIDQSGNYHFYKAVDSGNGNWYTAYNAAIESKFQGLNGYLMTITNSEEGNMGRILRANNNKYYWVGGTRAVFKGNAYGSCNGGSFSGWRQNACSYDNYIGHNPQNITFYDQTVVADYNGHMNGKLKPAMLTGSMSVLTSAYYENSFEWGVSFKSDWGTVSRHCDFWGPSAVNNGAGSGPSYHEICDNKWYWATGPDAGRAFYLWACGAITNGGICNSGFGDIPKSSLTTGTSYAVAKEFNDWSPNEPNMSPANEAFMMYNNRWNDYAYNNTNINGYIVEFSTGCENGCQIQNTAADSYVKTTGGKPANDPNCGQSEKPQCWGWPNPATASTNAAAPRGGGKWYGGVYDGADPAEKTINLRAVAYNVKGGTGNIKKTQCYATVPCLIRPAPAATPADPVNTSRANWTFSGYTPTDYDSTVANNATLQTCPDPLYSAASSQTFPISLSDAVLYVCWLDKTPPNAISTNPSVTINQITGAVTGRLSVTTDQIAAANKLNYWFGLKKGAANSLSQTDCGSTATGIETLQNWISNKTAAFDSAYTFMPEMAQSYNFIECATDSTAINTRVSATTGVFTAVPIEFDLAGGLPNSEITTRYSLKGQTAVTTPASTPQKTGFVFMGWCKTVGDGAGTISTSGGGEVCSVSKLMQNVSTGTINANSTKYTALWATQTTGIGMIACAKNTTPSSTSDDCSGITGTVNDPTHWTVADFPGTEKVRVFVYAANDSVNLSGTATVKIASKPASDSVSYSNYSCSSWTKSGLVDSAFIANKDSGAASFQNYRIWICDVTLNPTLKVHDPASAYSITSSFSASISEYQSPSYSASSQVTPDPLPAIRLSATSNASEFEAKWTKRDNPSDSAVSKIRVQCNSKQDFTASGTGLNYTVDIDKTASISGNDQSNIFSNVSTSGSTFYCRYQIVFSNSTTSVFSPVSQIQLFPLTLLWTYNTNLTQQTATVQNLQVGGNNPKTNETQKTVMLVSGISYSVSMTCKSSPQYLYSDLDETDDATVSSIVESADHKSATASIVVRDISSLTASCSDQTVPEFNSLTASKLPGDWSAKIKLTLDAVDAVDGTNFFYKIGSTEGASDICARTLFAISSTCIFTWENSGTKDLFYTLEDRSGNISSSPTNKITIEHRKIQWDANSGVVSLKSYEHTNSVSYTLQGGTIKTPENKPVKSGYNFISWCRIEGASTASVSTTAGYDSCSTSSGTAEILNENTATSAINSDTKYKALYFTREVSISSSLCAQNSHPASESAACTVLASGTAPTSTPTSQDATHWSVTDQDGTQTIRVQLLTTPYSTLTGTITLNLTPPSTDTYYGDTNYVSRKTLTCSTLVKTGTVSTGTDAGKFIYICDFKMPVSFRFSNIYTISVDFVPTLDLNSGTASTFDTPSSPANLEVTPEKAQSKLLTDIRGTKVENMIPTAWSSNYSSSNSNFFTSEDISIRAAIVPAAFSQTANTHPADNKIDALAYTTSSGNWPSLSRFATNGAAGGYFATNSYSEGFFPVSGVITLDYISKRLVSGSTPTAADWQNAKTASCSLSVNTAQDSQDGAVVATVPNQSSPVCEFKIKSLSVSGDYFYRVNYAPARDQIGIADEQTNRLFALDQYPAKLTLSGSSIANNLTTNDYSATHKAHSLMLYLDQPSALPVQPSKLSLCSRMDISSLSEFADELSAVCSNATADYTANRIVSATYKSSDPAPTNGDPDMRPSADSSVRGAEMTRYTFTVNIFEKGHLPAGTHQFDAVFLGDEQITKTYSASPVTFVISKEKAIIDINLLYSGIDDATFNSSSNSNYTPAELDYIDQQPRSFKMRHQISSQTTNNMAMFLVGKDLTGDNSFNSNGTVTATLKRISSGISGNLDDGPNQFQNCSSVSMSGRNHIGASNNTIDGVGAGNSFADGNGVLGCKFGAVGLSGLYRITIEFTPDTSASGLKSDKVIEGNAESRELWISPNVATIAYDQPLNYYLTGDTTGITIDNKGTTSGQDHELDDEIVMPNGTRYPAIIYTTNNDGRYDGTCNVLTEPNIEKKCLPAVGKIYSVGNITSNDKITVRMQNDLDRISLETHPLQIQVTTDPTIVHEYCNDQQPCNVGTFNFYMPSLSIVGIYQTAFYLVGNQDYSGLNDGLFRVRAQAGHETFTVNFTNDDKCQQLAGKFYCAKDKKRYSANMVFSNVDTTTTSQPTGSATFAIRRWNDNDTTHDISTVFTNAPAVTNSTTANSQIYLDSVNSLYKGYYEIPLSSNNFAQGQNGSIAGTGTKVSDFGLDYGSYLICAYYTNGYNDSINITPNGQANRACVEFDVVNPDMTFARTGTLIAPNVPVVGGRNIHDAFAQTTASLEWQTDQSTIDSISKAQFTLSPGSVAGAVPISSGHIEWKICANDNLGWFNVSSGDPKTDTNSVNAMKNCAPITNTEGNFFHRDNNQAFKAADGDAAEGEVHNFVNQTFTISPLPVIPTSGNYAIIVKFTGDQYINDTTTAAALIVDKSISNISAQECAPTKDFSDFLPTNLTSSQKETDFPYSSKPSAAITCDNSILYSHDGASTQTTQMSSSDSSLLTADHFENWEIPEGRNDRKIYAKVTSPVFYVAPNQPIENKLATYFTAGSNMFAATNNELDTDLQRAQNAQQIQTWPSMNNYKEDLVEMKVYDICRESDGSECVDQNGLPVLGQLVNTVSKKIEEGTIEDIQRPVYGSSIEGVAKRQSLIPFEFDYLPIGQYRVQLNYKGGKGLNPSTYNHLLSIVRNFDENDSRFKAPVETDFGTSLNDPNIFNYAQFDICQYTEKMAGDPTLHPYLTNGQIDGKGEFGCDVLDNEDGEEIKINAYQTSEQVLKFVLTGPDNYTSSQKAFAPTGIVKLLFDYTTPDGQTFTKTVAGSVQPIYEQPLNFVHPYNFDNWQPEQVTYPQILEPGKHYKPNQSLAKVRLTGLDFGIYTNVRYEFIGASGEDFGGVLDFASTQEQFGDYLPFLSDPSKENNIIYMPPKKKGYCVGAGYTNQFDCIDNGGQWMNPVEEQTLWNSWDFVTDEPVYPPYPLRSGLNALKNNQFMNASLMTCYDESGNPSTLTNQEVKEGKHPDMCLVYGDKKKVAPVLDEVTKKPVVDQNGDTITYITQPWQYYDIKCRFIGTPPDYSDAPDLIEMANESWECFYTDGYGQRWRGNEDGVWYYIPETWSVDDASNPIWVCDERGICKQRPVAKKYNQTNPTADVEIVCNVSNPASSQCWNVVDSPGTGCYVADAKKSGTAGIDKSYTRRTCRNGEKKTIYEKQTYLDTTVTPPVEKTKNVKKSVVIEGREGGNWIAGASRPAFPSSFAPANAAISGQPYGTKPFSEILPPLAPWSCVFGVGSPFNSGDTVDQDGNPRNPSTDEQVCAWSPAWEQGTGGANFGGSLEAGAQSLSDSDGVCLTNETALTRSDCLSLSERYDSLTNRAKTPLWVPIPSSAYPNPAKNPLKSGKLGIYQGEQSLTRAAPGAATAVHPFENKRDLLIWACDMDPRHDGKTQFTTLNQAGKEVKVTYPKTFGTCERYPKLPEKQPLIPDASWTPKANQTEEDRPMIPDKSIVIANSSDPNWFAQLILDPDQIAKLPHGGDSLRLTSVRSAPTTGWTFNGLVNATPPWGDMPWPSGSGGGGEVDCSSEFSAGDPACSAEESGNSDSSQIGGNVDDGEGKEHCVRAVNDQDEVIFICEGVGVGEFASLSTYPNGFNTSSNIGSVAVIVFLFILLMIFLVYLWRQSRKDD